MSVVRKSFSGYSKLDKEDREDIIHRRAQFLIYKALQQADSHPKRPPPPSFLRIRFCRLKIRIGRKLKKLRKGVLLSMSAGRAGVYKRITLQWKRLFERDVTSLPALFP